MSWNKVNKTGDHHYSLETWSPDGKYITYIADLSEDRDTSFKSDVYLLNVETKSPFLLQKEQEDFWQTSWSPNSRYLTFLGSEQEFKNATHSKVWLYDLEQKELICLTDGIDAPVGDYVVGDFQQGANIPGVQWAEDNKSFYFIVSDQAAPLFTMEIY